MVAVTRRPDGAFGSWVPYARGYFRSDGFAESSKRHKRYTTTQEVDFAVNLTP